MDSQVELIGIGSFVLLLLSIAIVVWFIVGLVFTRVKGPSCGRCGKPLEDGETLRCSGCEADLRIAGIRTPWIQVRARGRAWHGCIAWLPIVALAGVIAFESDLPAPVHRYKYTYCKGTVHPYLPTLQQTDLDTFGQIEWYEAKGNGDDPVALAHHLLRIQIRGHSGEAGKVAWTVQDGWSFSESSTGYAATPTSDEEVREAIHELLARICPQGPADRVAMQANVLFLQAMDAVHGSRHMSGRMVFDRGEVQVLERSRRGGWEWGYITETRLSLRGLRDVPIWLAWLALLIVPPALIMWRRRSLWLAQERLVAENSAA